MTRVGLGFDAHAFAEGRDLVIGGVVIPDSPGLAGHSDADVLSHSIADAILGAARLGDLGSLFPNDERWSGASSLSILAATVEAAAMNGWAVGNIDATVIAERPALAPHRPEMIANIAAAIGIDQDRVSVKATTTDALGFAGRGEGIAALAVVLLEAAGPLNS
ncbi:MAG TPA: 2-C-methyl-D-erythritol 2,4-cyclodiphosphate synthase [Actinomycetota bacterium]|nr:2-C-methyl-D-erythritol 2,4-cyclodiphosphate synthase [Actinomycetota bacterium]